MSTKKTRIKAPAATNVPQSKDDCAESITALGQLNRALARRTADMNDEIAAVTAKHQPELDALRQRCELLQEGIKTWCEANRDELTQGGKIKTANLVTGEIAWRQRPPSVRITGADSVIETFKRLGLAGFVRMKEEINKEAILNEPEQVRGVAGVTVVTGIEDFVITPFEQEAS